MKFAKASCWWILASISSDRRRCSSNWSAPTSGEIQVSQLLDELERLLVELAASPDQLATEDIERVQQRIAAKDLLFKVRVVSSAVKERQKQQTRSRIRVGQSS